MINHKNIFSPKGMLYTFQYFLLFFLVITSIPSTFALQVELDVNPFGNNAYFETVFQILTSVLLPIFVKETFNQRLNNPFLLSVFILLIAFDWTLTYRFTKLCHDTFGDPFFLSYYYYLIPLFVLYILECIFFMEFYISKYLNILATLYNFLVSLIFLIKAIDKEYIDKYLGYIIMWFMIVSFVIIVILNILSNYIIHSNNDTIIYIYEKKKNLLSYKNGNDENKSDNNNSDEEEEHGIYYNTSCPICLSHKYVHNHLDHGFRVNDKEKKTNDEEKETNDKEKKTNNKGGKNNCYCPICVNHDFIHRNSHKIKDNESSMTGKKYLTKKCNRIKKKYYLKINEKVNIFYFLLNLFCAASFTMISGPTALWSQFYMTINSSEYSMYQNSGPDSTYSIIENILYPNKKKGDDKKDNDSSPDSTSENGSPDTKISDIV
jgi:hypothetical protein